MGSGLRAGAVARADASWRAWGGGAEWQRSQPRGGGGDPPGYVAAIAAAARPLPTRPPTRPLAAGSCAAALPRSDGERQCVLAPHARCVSPRGHSCLPAPRRAAPESVVAAAGKGCGPAALTRRHGPGLDAPLPQQVKAEGGEAGGGTRGEGGRRGKERAGIPGARSPRGGGPEAGGERRGNPGRRGPGAGRKGSEASREADPGAGPEAERRRAPRQLPRPSAPGGPPGPDTPLPPPDSPGAFPPRLDLAPL